MIVDSSSTDNDTLTITTTTDVAGKPTVTGIENMNVNFSGFTAGGNTTLDIAMDNVGATKLNVASSGSTAVTSATIDKMANGTEVTTAATFGTVNLTDIDDNAAIVANTSAASATATSTLNVTAAGTGALTSLTANETVGHLDLNVTAGDLDGTLTVSGAKDVDVSANAAKTATITSGEDVTVTDLSAATSVNITATKTVTSAADKLDAATTLNVTAGEKITVDADAAQTVTISAAGVDASATGGVDNSSTFTGDALQTLNVSGNGAALELDVTDSSDTLKTIAVSGTQPVTVEMNASSIAAATELALTNSGTGAATLVLGTGDFADAVNLSKVATATNIRLDVDEDDGHVATVASGANVTFNAVQTDVAFTADASTAATNTLGLKVDKANTSSTTYAIADLTTTNIKEVSLDLSVDSADTTLGTVDVGAANNLSVSLGGNKLTSVTDVTASTLTITGSDDVTLADLTIAELNASAMTGKVSYTVQAGDVVRTGSADDTLTVSSGIDMSVQTFGGNDSLSLTGNYSAKTVAVDLGAGTLDSVTIADGANLGGNNVTIAGAEKFTFAGDATVNDTLLNGSSAAIFGGTNSDITIRLTQATNDFSSLAIDTATVSTADGDSFIINASGRNAAVSIVGTDADDVITGSNTSGSFADTLNGGSGDDRLIVTEGGDAVTGGSGTDTIDFTLIDDAFTDIEGGTSDATGMIVNLGTTAIAGTAVSAAMTTSFISGGLTEIAAGNFGYLFAANSTGNSSVVGTVASVENVVGSTGADYIVGSSAANTIAGGAGADVLAGGAGVDTFTLANVANVKATSDNITDFAAGENIAIQATAAGQFGDLHDSDGDAFTGAATGVVATVNIAGGAADLSPTDANVISINANTGDLTVGYANIAALQTAIDGAAITEFGGGPFADGDELLIVWKNTTDNAYEVGIITVAGGNGFVGADETYEKLLEVDVVGALTQAQVAASIDFIA